MMRLWHSHRSEIEKWAAENVYTLIFLSLLAVVEMVVIIVVGVVF